MSQTIKLSPTHRVFTPVFDVIAINVATMLGGLAAASQPAQMPTFAGLDCEQLGLEIDFDPSSVIRSMYSGDSPGELVLTVQPRYTRQQQFRSSPTGPESSQLYPERAVDRASKAMLVALYETYRDQIETRFGTELSMWPETLYFARKFRSAISHNKIEFKHAGVRAAKWRHLSFDHSDNGRDVTSGFLPGDIIMLMLDFGDELERLAISV